MYWYVVHVKLERGSKLVNFFNQQDRIKAFIPKMERWYNIKGKKDYIIKEVLTRLWVNELIRQHKKLCCFCVLKYQYQLA